MEMQKFSLADKLRIRLEQHRIISVVGAGGKTTLIFELARELQERGASVAVTTTTHMAVGGKYGFEPIGLPCGDGKIKGISREYPVTLRKSYDVVLVEADGSRRLPFKVPAEHEPVLPVETDLVIGVAGSGAVGQTFAQACCRYERACECLECGKEEVITPSHLVRALTAPWGQKKCVVCEYRYVVSQGDLLSQEQQRDIFDAARTWGEGKDLGGILSVKAWWYREL
ncbi:selenium cofactor biosynthesis protein YqeC [Roseburia hominis]